MAQSKNTELQIIILKILAKKYTNALTIKTMLKVNDIKYEQKELYPALSGLQIKNLLCSNWMYTNYGSKEKFYHLTRSGLNYIKQLKK